MIKAEIAMEKDNKVIINLSGGESEIVAESIVLLKSIYEGLRDAGAPHAKDSMRLAVIYTLLSGNLFDEEPCEELLDSLFEFTGVDKEAFYDKVNADTAILEDEDVLRKAFEKAAAYGD